MALPFCRWFEKQIAAALDRRMAVLLPGPVPCPGLSLGTRVAIIGKTLIVGTDIKEISEMTSTVENLRIRGDKKFYQTTGPIVILNEAGNPLDPQPSYASVDVSGEGLADVYLAVDGRIVIIPDDSQVPEAPWSANFSVVETGTEDDLVLSGVYDPDGIGVISAASLGDLMAGGAGDPLPERAS